MPALSFWISLKRLSASVITLQLNDKWRSFPEMFANGTLPQARDETKVFCFSSSRTCRGEFHYSFDFVQCIPLFDVVSRSLGRLRSLRNGNRTQGPPPLSGGKARERRSTFSPLAYLPLQEVVPQIKPLILQMSSLSFGLKLWKWRIPKLSRCVFILLFLFNIVPSSVDATFAFPMRMRNELGS